jgi:hypothetical protein
MSNSNKISKIESISFLKLKETMINLVKKLNYKDIKQENDIIIASNNSPLSSEKFLFILFDQRLSGTVDLQEIKKKILEKQEKHTANAIYIVSKNNISSGFEDSIAKEIPQFKLNFIGRDRLIKLIDEQYEDFWKHDDLALIEYEKHFTNNHTQNTDFKKLEIFNEKYQKLLDFYIEPRLSHFYEDKATQTPVRKRITVDDLLKDEKPMLISGDAGSGKSTLLKQIGKLFVKKNLTSVERRIPVLLTTLDIFENSYSIENLLKKKIEPSFENKVLSELFQEYKIQILIDSIDEFDETNQKNILKQLNKFYNENRVNYIIGTRNSDKICSIAEKNLFDTYSIERFNLDQVKKFISSFFTDQLNKADNLIENLRENRIIEKLPITPLTLSLISILYEENNYEIPATITDIYDNFNSLVIGRQTVSSSIEFIDISFKERILSLYALHLLEREQHTPLTKDEFFEYFNNFFSGKTLPIKKGSLEDVLNYLINHTGIIEMKDNKWIKFTHDSYMEYYGALEIFKHQREKEKDLVESFFENNWQNAAVFYAGKSKDLPKFLQSIIDKLQTSEYLNQYLSGMLGCGYLLQALYQTDNQLRKKAIIEALDMNIKATDVLMKLSSDDIVLFKNYNIPILRIMNLLFFYETFNSTTLKIPLRLAFDETISSFEKSLNPVDALKAAQLALTLDSKRIGDSVPLTRVIDSKEAFKDPTLYAILDFSLGMLGGEKYSKIKKEIRKDYFPRIPGSVRRLVELPASRVRFTNLDTISASKNIQLIVEGKTDAEIIEHAYMVLTNGLYPYWKIRVSGSELGGGANAVAKTISNCQPIISKEMTIIGIFDHDAKGLQEFKGLKIFEEYKNNTVRKHKECNIYALLIPVPGEYDFFLQKDQAFNFFEIEHYFGYDFLKESDILESTPIDKIYKIKDSKKKGFSEKIRKTHDKKSFHLFIDLFRQIDEITGVQIDYIEE